jgi:hypothetical protein
MRGVKLFPQSSLKNIISSFKKNEEESFYEGFVGFSLFRDSKILFYFLSRYSV